MQRLFIIFLILPCIIIAQDSRKEQRTVIENLRKHVGYLSDDSLEGRRAGTNGERMSAEYIAEQFRRNGLLPMNNSGVYIEPFTIDEGKIVKEGAKIMVEGKGNLEYPSDFQPLSNSSSASALKARFNPAINERGNVWSLDVSDWTNKKIQNPHFDLKKALNDEIVRMSNMGAIAVILIQSANSGIDTIFNTKDRSERLPIPAFYVSERCFKENFSTSDRDIEITIDYSIVPSLRTARNVVGWIDNKAQFNVVIGAHYDHLGYGEDGNSMSRNGDRSIHNGADDNASGTSAVIELSRLFKLKNPGTHNYIFVAFSGEELGLYGSKHFVEKPPYAIEKTSFMINLDMVGRLNDTTRSLTIGGYGTAKQWPELLAFERKGPRFKIRYDSSGTGPSDHTSFYRKDIPVLFFFTGLHSDYHKPTDDRERINYNGTKDIVRFIKNVVDRSRIYGKLDFQRTREQQTTTGTRFTVSMGIMPDYTYSGSGVRVDGVSEGRAAKAVGIKQGDIVIRLGDKDVDSVETYMRALSLYKKGDKTRVVIKRGSDTIVYDISF